MLWDQNPHQTVTQFRCVGFSMYACEFSVSQTRQFPLLTYPPRSKWASSEKMVFFFAKIGIFCKSIAGPFSEAKTLQLLNQLNFVWHHTKVFMQNLLMMSPKCSIVENDGELMLMTLHTDFLPQQQYSRLYALFLAFYALVYRWVCQFLSLFSQDNEHTELTVLLFF